MGKFTERFEPIQKPFYDALAEGKILGRRCPECGRVEFPPYPACNSCGAFTDEWVDLSDSPVVVHEIYSIKPMFTIPDYQPYAPIFGAECSMEEGPEFTCLIFGVNAENLAENKAALPLEGRIVAVPMEGYSTYAVAIDGAKPVRHEVGEAAAWGAEASKVLTRNQGNDEK